jgi:hypothetical protein
LLLLTLSVSGSYRAQAVRKAPIASVQNALSGRLGRKLAEEPPSFFDVQVESV